LVRGFVSAAVQMTTENALGVCINLRGFECQNACYTTPERRSIRDS
jgi:hypothetical protein